MKRAPVWVALLGVLVQVAALGLCNWAMEESLDRGRRLPSGTKRDAIPPAATA